MIDQEKEIQNLKYEIDKIKNYLDEYITKHLDNSITYCEYISDKFDGVDYKEYTSEYFQEKLKIEKIRKNRDITIESLIRIEEKLEEI